MTKPRVDKSKTRNEWVNCDNATAVKNAETLYQTIDEHLQKQKQAIEKRGKILPEEAESWAYVKGKLVYIYENDFIYSS